MLPGILMIIGMLTQPESPRYLVQIDDYAGARASLLRLSTYSASSPDAKVLQNVDETLAEIISDKESRGPSMGLVQQARAACADSRTAYRVGIAIIVMFFQQWTVCFPSLSCLRVGALTDMDW